MKFNFNYEVEEIWRYSTVYSEDIILIEMFLHTRGLSILLIRGSWKKAYKEKICNVYIAYSAILNTYIE